MLSGSADATSASPSCTSTQLRFQRTAQIKQNFHQIKFTFAKWFIKMIRSEFRYSNRHQANQFSFTRLKWNGVTFRVVKKISEKNCISTKSKNRSRFFLLKFEFFNEICKLKFPIKLLTNKFRRYLSKWYSISLWDAINVRSSSRRG